MTISKATSAEVSGLSQLAIEIISNLDYLNDQARELNVSAYQTGTLSKRLGRAHNLFLVAKDESGKIIAFCAGDSQAVTFYLEWIGVVFSQRKKGVARALLEYLPPTLKEKGDHKIWLMIRTENKESLAFFQNAGYSQVGLFQNHFFGQDYSLWEKFL
jgi:ribosomal protein S18 acetylase RimI-like enzyme